jgi:hypothetical protein
MRNFANYLIYIIQQNNLATWIRHTILDALSALKFVHVLTETKLTVGVRTKHISVQTEGSVTFEWKQRTIVKSHDKAAKVS